MAISTITGSLGFLVALAIVVLVRRDQMQIAKATFWLIMAVAFALLGLAPRLFDDLAKFVGVDYAPSLAFMLALIVLALKILIDDIEISRLKVRQRRLLQRMAILQAKIDGPDTSPHDNNTSADISDGQSKL